MDQGSRYAVSHVRLAARLWRIFREPEPARRCAAIHRWAKRAPSHSHLLGIISRVVAQARRRFRRALCLGLRIAPSIESRRQRLFRATTEYLGRCPRVNIDDAPLAFNKRIKRPATSPTSAKGAVLTSSLGQRPRTRKI